MKNRRLLIAVAVTALVTAGGAVAFADPAQAPATGETQAAPTVRLPTGDKVSLLPHGGIDWQPAEGREDISVQLPSALDGSGDVIVFPSDVLDDVMSGEQDPRRYNVSELLRAGETDAASAKSLSQKEYDEFVPAGDRVDSSGDDVQKVTVTLTGLDGEVPPEGSIVSYVSDETAELDSSWIDPETGSATFELPPGDYHISAGGGGVLGARNITVADKPVEARFDGTKAKPVKYEVDRESELKRHSVAAISELNGGAPYAMGIRAEAEDLNVIPADGKGIALQAKPQLATEDVFYHLDFFHDGGIPEELTFTAHDADLAEVTRRYSGVAGKATSSSCTLPDREGGNASGWCEGALGELPTSRVELFTVDKGLKWKNRVGYVGDSASLAFGSAKAYDSGTPQDSLANGPLGLYLGTPGEQVLRRDGNQIALQLPYIENPSPEEKVDPGLGAEGKVTMTKDGDEVGHAALKDGEGAFRLPNEDSGHYTLKAEIGHDGALVPFATKTSVEWKFDSEFTDEPTPVDASAVNFSPEGISNGYAEAGKDQKFTLDYVAQDGAADTDVKDLSFEVSYDDGKSWKEVEVSREGDSASGVLKHPGDAKFVSVRASATDAAGNKVTQSTLRTFGLK